MDNIKITGKFVKALANTIPDDWEVVCIDKDGKEIPWDKPDVVFDPKNKKAKIKL